MTLINIRNLGVTLNAPLFSRLDLSVNAGDRIGLVAANGRGKSTLLRCIAGMAEPSEGEIARSRGLTSAMSRRMYRPRSRTRRSMRQCSTCFPSNDGQSEGWSVDVALESLEVPEALWQRPLKQLSGGWQRFAMLARVLVAEAECCCSTSRPTIWTSAGFGSLKPG